MVIEFLLTIIIAGTFLIFATLGCNFFREFISNKINDLKQKYLK